MSMKSPWSFLLCFAALTLPPLSGKEPPNIVLIMVDDMGFSDIGCYGSEIPTPHLDALAGEGLKFSQFYNTGRCCPTRASLLTGQYSHRTGLGWMTSDQGVPGYRGFINEEVLTIPEVLNPAGYFTAMTGKWHVGWRAGVTPQSRGFHRSLNTPAGGLHFDDQTGSKGSTALYLNGENISRQDARLSPPWYGTDLWTDWGLKFMDEARAEEKPFFLFLSHVAPHFPCMAPEATIAKYRGKYLVGWDQLREERYARQIELGLVEKSWPLSPRPEDVPAWDSLSKKEQKRYDDMMAIYAAMIEEVDQSVGKLVAGLKERGVYDNTLILFLTDNGGNAEQGVKGRYEGENPGDQHSNVFVGKCWALLQNTPFRLYKHYNHEGGIASPLIAHWPDGIKPRDAWIETPTHLIDLLATFTDLSSADYPEQFRDQEIAPLPGVSLRPLFKGKDGFPKRTLYWEHEGNAAVREGDWKLVRQGRDGEWELYQMSTDRTEQTNLAAKNPDVVANLKAHWTAWGKANYVLPYPAAQNPDKVRKSPRTKGGNQNEGAQKKGAKEREPAATTEGESKE